MQSIAMQTHRVNNRSRACTSKMVRLNGENIAGAAFLFLSALFVAGAQVNGVLATLYPVYFIFIATGVALVVLGYRTSVLEQGGEAAAGTGYAFPAGLGLGGSSR